MARTTRLSPVIAFVLAAAVLSFVPIKQAAGEQEDPIKTIMHTMSLEEKIAQMLIVGFDGTEALGPISTLVRDLQIGGVILFEYNLPDQRSATALNSKWLSIPTHALRLTNSLQILATTSKNRIPLFISADQENGTGVIFERGMTVLPGNMSLGQTRNERYAYNAGRITGLELRAIGVNVDLAPVVDVNTNSKNDIIGTRSFGGNQEIVSRLGVQFMLGLHEAGVLAVPKHFPGASGF